MSCFAKLKGKGFRLTQPRKVILDYIHQRGDHLTAEEIISHVHISYPRINKSTIYRTLEMLENNDCVYKSESDGNSIYHHAEEGHHHHLKCRKCGKSVDCPEDIFNPVKKALKKEYGFNIEFKHMVMQGICEDCRKSL